jgi:hypothetical protein
VAQVDEQQDVLARFMEELRKPTGDGKNKRARGEKPPWYNDNSHPAAMYRHLERWEAGERYDPDHEAHPLVAMAWRALAIACKESGNIPK